MNPSSHILLTSILILLYSLQNRIKFPFWYVLILSVVAGWGVDWFHHCGGHLGKPHYHRRIFVEEPLGIILFLFPVCGALLLIIGKHTAIITFFGVILHIVCDYISVPHQVAVLDPLIGNNWNITAPLNIFQSVMHTGSKKKEAQALMSEWVIVITASFAVILLLIHYFLHYQDLEPVNEHITFFHQVIKEKFKQEERLRIVEIVSEISQ
ncbi:hypothetical protein P9112_009275 [Eukaryota sp. TZLM1-RC]